MENIIEKKKIKSNRICIFLSTFNLFSITNNYFVKGKIDKTQQSCKWKLCRHRNETINQMIARREYKTRHD